MNIQTILSVAGLLLIFLGSALTLAAAIGLLRFNNVLMRMHPAAKPQVLGLILVMAGASLRLRSLSETGIFFLAALFAVITSPVIANRVSNIAYRESAEVSADPKADPLEDA